MYWVSVIVIFCVLTDRRLYVRNVILISETYLAMVLRLSVVKTCAKILNVKGIPRWKNKLTQRRANWLKL